MYCHNLDKNILISFVANYKQFILQLEGMTSNLEITGSVFFKPKVNVTLDISDRIVKSVGIVFSGNAELKVAAIYNAVSSR